MCSTRCYLISLVFGEFVVTQFQIKMTLFNKLNQLKVIITSISLTVSLAIAPATSHAQRNILAISQNDSQLDDWLGVPEFTWIRGIYTNYGGWSGSRGRPGDYGRGRRGPGGIFGGWDTDYPDSDQNFLLGVNRYTHIDTKTTSHKQLELTDPELFEHTFLYMNMKRVPIGTTFSGPEFRPDEIEALREFMFRGGFVLLDDFWGEAHWNDFLMEITKIFPERELVKLETSHELFHIFFDIDEVVQVPGRMVTWGGGGYFELDHPDYPPTVHAILDDEGRVMLAANFNTDLGDGWEHTFYEPFPTKYSNEAYKIGINYLIYAFSH